MESHNHRLPIHMLNRCTILPYSFFRFLSLLPLRRVAGLGVTVSEYVFCVFSQLLSHLTEQKLKHERMVQLQNQIMSENARLHGAIQVAGDNLERTGHISRDLEFANQMVRDENQRSVRRQNGGGGCKYASPDHSFHVLLTSCAVISVCSLLSPPLRSIHCNPSNVLAPTTPIFLALFFHFRLQDRIQSLLETVGALREELRGSFKSSEMALSNMTVERREWQVMTFML
jgi:hypothetical protein